MWLLESITQCPDLARRPCSRGWKVLPEGPGQSEAAAPARPHSPSQLCDQHAGKHLATESKLASFPGDETRPRERGRMARAARAVGCRSLASPSPAHPPALSLQGQSADPALSVKIGGPRPRTSQLPQGPRWSPGILPALLSIPVN